MEVNSTWFGRTKYTVTVNAGTDCAFVLLLVMIMEKDQQRNRHAAALNAGAVAGF